MKKLIKISLVAVAALLFFLNVSLKMNGNKVEALNVNTDIKIAQALNDCSFYIIANDCICAGGWPYCIAFCEDGCSGAIVE